MTSSLDRVPFGQTDMSITRVGFGAWAIGGGDWTFAWGDQDDAESVSAIRHAVSLGVNWIDTAAVYGLGHSEEVVARALADIPLSERPYVFTKCGYVWDPSDRTVAPHREATAESVRREVEDSLRRLNVEQIDLYQVHWPPADETPVGEYWQVLADLKQAGKLRAIGLSNHRIDQLEAAEQVGHVDSLQPPFSAINRAQADEIAWCAKNGTAVIVYSPMQSGLLTGSFSKERVAALPANDWRSRSAEYKDEKLERNLALADAMKPIAAKHGISVAAVAVAWTLAWPGVTGAIVGARSTTQVDGWIGAASAPLDDEDMTAIASAIEATGAGQGPVWAG